MNSLKDKGQFKSSSKGILYYSIIAALLIISSSLYASYDQEKNMNGKVGQVALRDIQ